jgi:hypothetical protein
MSRSSDRLLYDEGDGHEELREFIIVDNSGNTALLHVPSYFTEGDVEGILDGEYTIAIEAC